MRCLLSMSTSYVCGGWNKFNRGQKYYWQDHMISFQTRGQQFHSTIKWQLRKHFLCVSFPPTTSPLFLLTIFFCSLEKFCKKKIENYQQIHVRSHFWKIADEFTQLLLSHHHHHPPHIEEGKSYEGKKTHVLRRLMKSRNVCVHVEERGNWKLFLDFFSRKEFSQVFFTLLAAYFCFYFVLKKIERANQTVRKIVTFSRWSLENSFRLFFCEWNKKFASHTRGWIN